MTRKKGFHHSEETKNKIRIARMGHPVTQKTRDAVSLANRIRTGKLARHWKGGRLKNRSEGYIAIYYPNHPNADSLGYVKEHRLVMEKHIGRFLRKEEIVHHVNKIRTDNRIENLMVMSLSEHFSLHNKGIKKCAR